MTASDLALRRLAAADLPLLHDWIQRPHVLEWWGGQRPPRDLVETRAKYLPRVDEGSSTKPYIVSLAGRPIGFIQSYVAMECGDGWWEDETDPGVHGTDQFLGEKSLLGRGIGTAMVRAFVQRLFADPKVTRVQTDPDPANARAIRCYEKAGFRRAGVIQTPGERALLMVIDRG